MNRSKILLALSATAVINTSSAMAAGLSLSQIGTADSVATAGVAGVTNNSDAAATITNAAGLSGIEDSNMMLGGQLLDVRSHFEPEEGESTRSSGLQFIPHLSYAKRLNEDWVAGIALHSPGGLGVAYSNGIAGGAQNIIKENKITMLSLTASAAYQVNEQLALGASIITNYAGVEASVFDRTVTGKQLAPTFALSAQYQLSEKTRIGANYQHGSEHDIEFDEAILGIQGMAINWPATFDIGIDHQLTEKLNIMANAKWQSWSDYDANYQDTYSAGIAAGYQAGDWLWQAGFSIDSSPVDAEYRDVVLPLDKQWRLGIGAEKTLASGAKLGIAYQYQNLGDAEIASQGRELLRPSGEYSENRVHFITLSYQF
ncbi:OmpP1/FadL family transporter [Shewanella atlantica]|uniref:Aromatic hydrocarbon degradation protein n=1 Tax=Shewanella atlantica TaxID=271099 RepID=A0A3S0LBQ5_9GAMM|nr:outer membrane protein transport protein [Shewanella atlantica]RTR31645.1 aromatic hydrocarbon degradation protein [Shewanella atlantica]